MICPPWLAILLLGAAGATSALAGENATKLPSKSVTGAFILECEDGQICESVAKAVEEKGGTVRHMLKSDVFNGISIQLPKFSTEEDRKTLQSQFKGIKASWPVQEVTQAPESTAKDQPEDKHEAPYSEEERLDNKPEASPKSNKRHYHLGRRADDDRVESPWNHLMTHVDKLHEEGYTGGGIKIAVVDTGVDYTHPALGGCLGPGCKVATGDNFSNQGDKNDPMDCHGHGTRVAGVLAGYSEADDFVGAAPNATIMAYRVLNCEADGSEDDMIAGWLKAKEDGAQIIISSSGFQGDTWAHRPLAMVAARIVASGVPCVGGLGNKDTEGLFYAMNPSTGHGVTSVNSFIRDHVALEYRGEYSIGNRSEPVNFTFGLGDYWSSWDRELRPVHDLDADFGDKPDDELVGAKEVPLRVDEFKGIHENCTLSPGNSSTGLAQDLVGHIVLIRQTPETKDCHFYDRVQNAVARGAEHILAWQNNPVSVEVRPKDTLGRSIKAIGIAGAGVGRVMASSLASGQPVTARRIGRVRIETGSIAPLSAYGPTWELDIKPSVGAPGHMVPVTTRGGGYASDKGTSFAGPLVAGVFALMAEIRGTFDPALLNSLIMSTAEPQIDDGRLATVARQGGGLLRAWEAAHATSLVEPGALRFNDTDNRPRSIGLRITNTAKTEVTYRLSNLAAATMYTLKDGWIFPGDGEIADATADIKLSQTSITIGAGQSATVDLSATDPIGLDAKRLPLWSGWVSIQGSDGRNLTVPYLGMSGSLRSAAVFATGSALSSLAGPEFILRSPPEGQESGPDKAVADSTAAVRGQAISTSFALVLGSPQRRHSKTGRRCRRANLTEPDLSQACVPGSIITEFSGVRSIGQLPGYPQHYVQRGSFDIGWDGAFAPGQYAPPGRYKIVARALSIMGDAGNETDWQIVESPVFSIAYEQEVKVPQASQPASGNDSSEPAQPSNEELDLLDNIFDQ